MKNKNILQVASVHAKSLDDVWVLRYNGPYAAGGLVKFSGTNAMLEACCWLLDYLPNGTPPGCDAPCEANSKTLETELRQRAEVTVKLWENEVIEFTPIKAHRGGGIGLPFSKRSKLSWSEDKVLRKLCEAIEESPRRFRRNKAYKQILGLI
jgi:hypothetical protein